MTEDKKIIESFNGSTYGIHIQKEPSCFNGMVSLEKYRFTVEKIKEPVELYRERLIKIWKLTDNYHHTYPLIEKAKELGISLDRREFGIDLK
ncbi:hypothetical protein LCGC14_0371050 [marine sediment metagenome]|uniref:Uncharacterized protein n=1 Tax=marine sediment metagenome TaxID=412755 RepID=A0A0F9TB79_9ZZZZ|nr:hypothetical protein [Maribacter sp.]HDZ04862.1 hypothetical protein [Maribacter sp.]